jgi:hypothetical protein
VTRALVLLAWALALVQVLTIQPSVPMSVPAPLSWEHAVIVGAFLATSLASWWRPGHFVAGAAHVAVLLGVLALHPLTAFGRDGSTVAVMVWLCVSVARLPIRREWVLATASTCVALLATDAVLAAIRPPAVPVDLPDYGEVMGDYGDCGFLRPSLSMDVVGEDGPARFVTNRLGLRVERDVTPTRPADGLRVLFLGDSFVAGYRTDQRDTVGAQLENALRARFGPDVDVLSAGSGQPKVSARLIATCAPRVGADRVLVGVTLGNDLGQSWIEHRDIRAVVLDGLFLPDDASKGAVGQLPIRLLRTVRTWRILRRLEALVRPDVISSWYLDPPTRVHLFDPGHSLGHFYARRQIDLVEESYDAVMSDLRDAADEAKALGIPVMFALFPQRFQTTDREWQATLFEYGLDPDAFDPEAPNRRLRAECEAAGLTCIDLLPAFRAAADPGGLYQPRGDMHWNRLGHAVAAEALAEAVARRH